MYYVLIGVAFFYTYFAMLFALIEISYDQYEDDEDDDEIYIEITEKGKQWLKDNSDDKTEQ